MIDKNGNNNKNNDKKNSITNNKNNNDNNRTNGNDKKSNNNYNSRSVIDTTNMPKFNGGDWFPARGTSRRQYYLETCYCTHFIDCFG